MNVLPRDNGRFRLDLTVQREMPVIPAIVRSVVEMGGDVWLAEPKELTLDDMFSIVVEKSHARAPEREKVPA